MALAKNDFQRRLRAARAPRPRGALLYDPDRIDPAAAGRASGEGRAAQGSSGQGATSPGDAVLDPGSYGSASGETARGGRGTVWFVQGAFGAGVLRHYRRGGALARINRDRYLFRGEERTRPFREFRLLQALHAQGLPVPRPLAAGYARSGAFYRADILIERIQDARTLAESLRDGEQVPWRGIGAELARFHAARAFHADLNAHNILLSGPSAGTAQAPPGVWLIDFDRGALRAGHAWKRSNLRRLQRSLRKLAGADARAFDDAGWMQLLDGYAAGQGGR